jgi:hypothetical protein
LYRLSVLFYWTLYIVVYIPSLFTPVYMAMSAPTDLFWLLLALGAGLPLMGLCYLIPLSSVRLRPLPRRLVWFGIAAYVILASLWIIVEFRNTMRLVTLDEIYTLREAAKAIVQSSKVGYAMLPLALIFNPILMTRGLLRKKVFCLVAGIAGQILIFACTGLKSAPLSIFAVLAVYLLARFSSRHFGLMVALVTAASFVVFSVIAYRFRWSHSIAVDALLFTIVQRMFDAPGVLTAQYFHFFTNHPLTYMSHVKGFSQLIQYPYQYPLGYEIGNFYVTPGILLNQNAHVWATDGMAAFGLPGILMISCFVSVIFWLSDWAAQHHDIKFSAPVMAYVAFEATNMGIFTILASGGLLIAIFLLAIMPAEANPVSDRRDAVRPRGF